MDSAEFRAKLVAVCQAPLPEAQELLVEAPELLSDLSEEHQPTLIAACRDEGDWRSEATLRRALSLIGNRGRSASTQRLQKRQRRKKASFRRASRGLRGSPSSARTV